MNDITQKMAENRAMKVRRVRKGGVLLSAVLREHKVVGKCIEGIRWPL